MAKQLKKTGPLETPEAAAGELAQVYKTRQMFDVEQERGVDIRLVLIGLYNELGSQAAVAKALGVSQPTIDAWFEMLGIEIMTTTEAVLVKRK